MKIKFPLLLGLLLLISALTSAITVKKKIIEAEAGETTGGALKLTDDSASKGYIVCLEKPGQAVKFSNLPLARKLAIRYASLNVVQ